MRLEDLLKLIPEENRAEVESDWNALEAKIKKLKDEIEDLEDVNDNSDLQEKLETAILKRDISKQALQIFRDKIGIPKDAKITKDLIDEYLKDETKGDNEKDKRIRELTNDIDALEVTINKYKDEADKARIEVENVKSQTEFEKSFHNVLPDFEPASTRARKDIEALLKQDAEVVGDVCFYKKDDKHIRIEGVKMDIKMKLALLKTDPETMYLFKSKASTGSGSSNYSHSSGGKFTARLSRAGL